MTDPVNTEYPRREPGTIARNIGIIASIVFVVWLLNQAAENEVTALPVVGSVVGIALIVIGYLQKISSKY